MAFSFFRGSKPSLVQKGPGAQNRTHVLDKPETSIGRAANADITIDDPFLAPIHARVERASDGTFTLRRMGLNPIVLRGETILQTATLKSGDSFRLGKDIEFEFVMKAAKNPVKSDLTDLPPEKKPLLKRPAFLAALGLVYLALMGGVAYSILSGGDEGDDTPTAARIDAEASGIVDCVKSARRMKNVSQASFNGAVGGRVSMGEGQTYAMLALSDQPQDDEALTSALAPVEAAYKKAALAALASEIRGNKPLALQLYQQTFDIVPDINCPAARFALQRRAAVTPEPEE